MTFSKTISKDSQRLEIKWDDALADKMSEPEKLLYRSNLLGSDKRITNYGGGNTSAKVTQKDPLTGDMVDVLWVKGSGGDVGSIKMDGFSTLYMDKLNALRGIYRGVEFEDEMVAYLPHCTFNLNPRAASIDTPLHAYVPAKHVDHMHPDAIIAIAAAKDSKALTQQIFGDSIGWLPWKKPGYELGLWLSDFCAKNPDAKGVVLESHGLFTWADDAKDCYELTVNIIQTAMDWFTKETAGKDAFGGAVHKSMSAEERRATAARLMPRLERPALTISCARKFARWWWILIPPSRMWTQQLPVSRTQSRNTASVIKPIMTVARRTTALPFVIPMPWST